MLLSGKLNEEKLNRIMDILLEEEKNNCDEDEMKYVTEKINDTKDKFIKTLNALVTTAISHNDPNELICLEQALKSNFKIYDDILNNVIK